MTTNKYFPTLLEEYTLSHNDKRQGNSLIQFISFTNTFDHYIGSQYKDMRISRLVILVDPTWPRPLDSVRSGHLEAQASRSSYPGIDFLGSNWLDNMHKLNCCNWFIIFNIPIYFGEPGYIFRHCLLCFFSNSKAHELIHLISYIIVLIQCVQIDITNSVCTNL